MIRTAPIATSLPGLTAVRWAIDAPYVGLKQRFAVGRVLRGRARWAWGGISEPGAIGLGQPGDIHKALEVDGTLEMEVVTFAQVPPQRLPRELAARDPRRIPFARLFAALRGERLGLEVAVAELHAALAGMSARGPTRAVRDARDYLADHADEPVALATLADAVGLAPAHLCRAFRAQVGIPPHAYLIQLRVARARALLDAGARPSEAAIRAGFYDQSQLHRHFRRIVGVTPGQYARSRC